MTAVSMRELQKMSADRIRSLSHPVPIQCGGETIGMLSPMRRPDLDRLRAAFERLDAEPLELTADELERARQLVGELDLD